MSPVPYAFILLFNLLVCALAPLAATSALYMQVVVASAAGLALVGFATFFLCMNPDYR